ncbi:glycosyltransferase family 2 protein [Paenibacillus sp. CAU 1782]
MERNSAVQVSIIVPVYNVELYLKDCLNSLLHQTFRDIEIICINDASTDHSLDILRKYAHMDNRIVIIDSPENRGLSYSRNQGLAHARGEYVYFLDSDDLIVPNAIEELFIHAEEKNLDIVYFEAQLLFENKELNTRFHSYKEEFNVLCPDVASGTALFTHLISNRDWVASVCRQFWRRDYLKENNFSFYENIIHEDELFSFLTLINANRVSCLKKQYFIRRIREQSITTSAVSRKNFIGVFICYCEIIMFWEKRKFNNIVNQSIADYLFRLSTSLKNTYLKINGDVAIEDIEKIASSHQNFRQLFSLFISNINNGNTAMLGLLENEEKVRQIEIHSKVVIYGAGIVAKDILELLNRNDKSLYCFAVSDVSLNKKFLMGHPVVGINDLIPYKNEVVILLGISSRYKKKVNEKLEELGFKNIIKF